MDHKPQRKRHPKQNSSLSTNSRSDLSTRQPEDGAAAHQKQPLLPTPSTLSQDGRDKKFPVHLLPPEHPQNWKSTCPGLKVSTAPSSQYLG